MACDLHCHTKISDGSLGIEELIMLAKRRKLSAISITDHDSTAGATRGMIIGKRMDMPVIHGIEISVNDTAREKKAHLLSYMCTVPDRLEGLCRFNIENRKKTAAEQIRRVMRYYPITPEMILKCATGSASIYEQHIMHALIDAGYADSFYGSVYDKLFGAEGCAVVETEYVDIKEALETVHSAGGVAVLAHPYREDGEGLLEELTALGLDGVEVWSPHHTEEQSEKLEQFARDNHLLMTGGSNFHGMYTKKARPVGSITASNDCVQELLNYKSGKKAVKS